jgi:predicted transcriptional regulator
MMLTTRQVAEELGTTPKTLRTFLRKDDTFGGVGSGSRYSFDKKDLPRLKKRFQEWVSGTGNYEGDKPKGAIVNGKAYIKGEGEKGMDKSILTKKLNKAERDEIRRKAAARVDRLEAALKSRNLHISQMKRREYR